MTFPSLIRAEHVAYSGTGVAYSAKILLIRLKFRLFGTIFIAVSLIWRPSLIRRNFLAKRWVSLSHV